MPRSGNGCHGQGCLLVPASPQADGDAEALGMVFAEAQATGLPVVSCYHGGVPEVVLDGQTGLLAPSVIPMPLRSTSFDCSGMGCFGRRAAAVPCSWMEERFDLVKQTQELEQIYSSLLK